MAWEVEFTDEFGEWWNTLDPDEQVSVDAGVGLLEAEGPQLGFPYSSQIMTSRYAHMRELRLQHRGEPYRVLYAFDPRRIAILLIGGSKTGDDRWYERMVPRADRLYEEHLAELRREGLSDGS
ncbi:MAG: type II toxin-antitoxin system RelE/ParE family toxin [Gemmatimonadota bacterium]